MDRKNAVSEIPVVDLSNEKQPLSAVNALSFFNYSILSNFQIK